MKKWIALLLTLVLLLSMTACSSSNIPKFISEDYDLSGTCGENAQWGFKEETGELTIIGTGEMDDYTSEAPAPWREFEVRSASIYGVTSIGDYAFAWCDSLTEITIPDSVTSIGSDAFWACNNLTSVAIPDSVTSIGDVAFWSCDSLTEVTIGDSVTSIGRYAFCECRSLAAIKADNRAYVDVDGVLYTSDMKTLVKHPKGKTDTFYTIPNSVTTIENGAFESDSLTEVTIGNSVTFIGKDTFAGCNSLTSITIPNSVTTIGDWAFSGCDSLTVVYYGGTEEQWNAIKIGGNNDPLTEATIHFNS